jgi:hypothetical protein
MKYLLVCMITFDLVLAVRVQGADAQAPKPIEMVKVERSTPVDFEKEVLPLLNASCVACHSKTKPKAGLVLETPADIRKGGDTGPAVVAGKPGESLLIKSAAHAPEKDVEPMPPPGNKANAKDLTGEQLGLIALWIEQGATGEVKASAPLAWRAVAESVRPVYAVAVTPDGAFAAAGRGNGIDVYNLKDNKLIARLCDPSLGTAGDRAPVAHRDLVQSLAFSPDGRTLASGAYREVKLWVLAGGSGAGTAGVPVLDLAKTIGTGGPDSPLSDRVNALDFGPDGERLAIGGGVPSRSGQVIIWSLADGRAERTLDELHSDSVLCLQFSADGKRLVTGSADKFVRLVNLEDGKVIRSFEGHGHHVLGVSLKRDGKVIASAGADNAMRFWDVETGERRRQSPTFEKEVTGVRFIGDTDTVVACSGDAKVRTVKDNGSDGKSLPGPADFMFAAAASADGKVIVAGGQDGVVRVWSMPEGKVAATFP